MTPKWNCRKCGVRMHPELAAAVRKTVPLPDSQPIVHVCGLCHAFHAMDGDRLRLLTSAETFHLCMQVPEAVARIERGDFFLLAGKVGTVILAKK